MRSLHTILQTKNLYGYAIKGMDDYLLFQKEFFFFQKVNKIVRNSLETQLFANVPTSGYDKLQGIPKQLVFVVVVQNIIKNDRGQI
jgi:hypothetical protein